MKGFDHKDLADRLRPHGNVDVILEQEHVSGPERKQQDESHSGDSERGTMAKGTPIICETVTVTVEDESGVAITEIPAFTVPATKLRLRLLDLMDEYLSRSATANQQVSLGDFALYLVAKASDDPREIPA